MANNGLAWLIELQRSPRVAPLFEKAKAYGLDTSWHLPGLIDYENFPGDTDETYIARLKKEISKYEDEHGIKNKQK
jgi:hypothetical protein